MIFYPDGKAMISLNEYVTALYNKSSGDDLSPFPKAVRDEYYKTGNRENFEKLYFRRRDFLSSCAFLALSDSSYIPQLEKIIMAICEEYCWALPAHTDGTRQGDGKEIDLFVAETSFTLAEIITVLDESLSSTVKDTVKREIQKRLVKSFREQAFWWESCNMNWASVCGGFTGGTLIYLFPEEFQAQKQRLLDIMRCYISGFSPDGTCLEGAGYWLYGFSALTYFADLLLRHTRGEINLFADEKLEKIAGYMESLYLKGNCLVSFSDADEKAKADIALQYYLSEKYPRSVHILPENQMEIWGGNTKWPCLYRTSLWASEKKRGSYTLKSHIRENHIIINKEGYSFALKGGNNAEPHNHNDLGSFIFADKDGQALCDLGAGRYTKDYFNENRYDVFCNSSLGHNVPIIGGKPQAQGKKHFALLSYEKGRAFADITRAYDIKGLELFLRDFTFNENSVILTDTVRADNTLLITDRFVTLRKPEIRDNRIILGSTEISFDKSKASLEIKKEYHLPHEYDKEPLTVYCLDFILKADTREITFDIRA